MFFAYKQMAYLDTCRPILWNLQSDANNEFQMVTVYSPLTWGMYTEPPPDIPECGFVGELCPAAIKGESFLVGESRT